MISKAKFNKEIDLIIANAIREDVGSGDYTSLACIPDDDKGKAKLLAKEHGIIAGVEFARRVFDFVDTGLKMEVLINDGEEVKPGDIVFYVSGDTLSILKSERLVLNAMQRMSAIATKTKEYVDLLEGTGTKILDTRKTTPGVRALEKWAVKIGGGENHRFALYDMVMIKDNHIDFCGSITEAINKTKAYLKAHSLYLKIIVEARNLKEVEEILRAKCAYRILLDNFNYEDTRKAVELIGDDCMTESSGGINKDTLRKYAECGVDYISSGALTHSVHNMDLSLKAV
jgi:nicotinate-nucleotide pyrophosphorylase (carboxylating)